MQKDQIHAQRTYRATGGRLLYVQGIDGEKVTFVRVGETERIESSLGRFALRVEAEVPNQ